MANLQKEIRQSVPFMVLEEEVFLNLHRTSYVLKKELVDIFKTYGISDQQYNVLRILRGAGTAGLACSSISERLIVADPDITRLLDRLAEAQLIVRERSVEDRRVMISEISASGLTLLEQLDQPVTECVRGQLEHLGSDMLEKLNSLLVLARDNSKPGE